MFYLMPLGHADILHFGKLWLGLVFVLFPLGFLLYGVNDIVDAETDALNPRKGTFLFGSRGALEQLAALKWQIAIVQVPFGAAFYFLVGPRILWWYRMEGPPAVRRADSGELLAHFCAEQLAEPCSTTSLADLFVWSDVCDALACFWRGDGHRARPVERPENNGDSDREGSREILDCRLLNDRNSPGDGLLSGLDHCELPGFGNAVVLIGCNFTLEKPGL